MLAVPVLVTPKLLLLLLLLLLVIRACTLHA